MNANKKKRIQKVYNRQIKNVRAAQSWVVHKSDPSGSNVQIQQNQVKMTWPKVSSTIYPGQTLRVNTGWKNTSIPDNMTITSMPHKSLIQNNLISVPQFMDSSNQGQQLSQVVMNNNNFPVRIQYKTNQSDGSQTFQLFKLHPQTLLQVQLLGFDIGGLLTGVAQLAGSILPFIL